MSTLALAIFLKIMGGVVVVLACFGIAEFMFRDWHGAWGFVSRQTCCQGCCSQYQLHDPCGIDCEVCRGQWCGEHQ